MSKERFLIPDWAVCPIVNDVWDGLTDAEEKQLKDFIEETRDWLGEGYFVDPAKIGFRSGNDISNLAGDVYEIYFVHNKTS